MAKLIRQLNNAHTLIDSSTAPLLARMRASLSSSLGRPIEDGDPELIAAASLLPYFGQGLAAADIASKAMLLQFATGDDLDAIGTHYGMARRPVAATMIVRLDRGETPIPDDTYTVSITGNVVDGGPAFSYIDASFNVPALTSYVEFTLVCAFKGAAYNAIDTLDDVVFTFSPNGGGVITDLEFLVYEASKNGLDAETDDMFASRIYDTIQAKAAAGSAAGYEALARQIEGVYDATAFAVALSPGIIYVVFIAPGMDTDVLVAEMRAHVDCPLGGNISGDLWPETARGAVSINWYTPSGSSPEAAAAINVAVNSALDALLAPLYRTYTLAYDINAITNAITAAGGVSASVVGGGLREGAQLTLAVTGYTTEFTFARVYQGVSEWI